MKIFTCGILFITIYLLSPYKLSGEVAFYKGVIKTAIQEEGQRKNGRDVVSIYLDSTGKKYRICFQMYGNFGELLFDSEYLWDGTWGLRRDFDQQIGILEDKEWEGFSNLDHRGMALFYAKKKATEMLVPVGSSPTSESVKKIYDKLVHKKQNPLNISIEGIPGKLPYRCSLTVEEKNNIQLKHKQKQKIEVLEWADTHHLIPKRSVLTVVQGPDEKRTLSHRGTWQLTQLKILSDEEAKEAFQFNFEGIKRLHINNHIVSVRMAQSLHGGDK